MNAKIKDGTLKNFVASYLGSTHNFAGATSGRLSTIRFVGRLGIEAEENPLQGCFSYDMVLRDCGFTSY